MGKARFWNQISDICYKINEDINFGIARSSSHPVQNLFKGSLKLYGRWSLMLEERHKEVSWSRSCRISPGYFWGQVRQVSTRNDPIPVVMWWDERTGCPCLWALNPAWAGRKNCSGTCLCLNSHFWGALLYYSVGNGFVENSKISKKVYIVYIYM